MKTDVSSKEYLSVGKRQSDSFKYDGGVKHKKNEEKRARRRARKLEQWLKRTPEERQRILASRASRSERKHQRRKLKWQDKHRVFLRSAQWQVFRDSIVAARKVCERCHSVDRLNVHHKHYDSYRHEKPVDVLLLCEKCHYALHSFHDKNKASMTLSESSDAFLKG